MLYVMRQAKYTPTDRLQGDSSFWYNNGENWHFRLWGNTTARIEYHYTNRLGEEDAIALIYSLEGAKGQDILDKALEIAKRSN